MRDAAKLREPAVQINKNVDVPAMAEYFMASDSPSEKAMFEKKRNKRRLFVWQTTINQKVAKYSPSQYVLHCRVHLLRQKCSSCKSMQQCFFFACELA